MGKIIDAIGISVIAVGVAGGITAGAIGLYNLAMPKDYKIEEKRGSKIVYNRDGDIFVKSDPKNMINYLVKEDSDRLRYALESLESKIFSNDYDRRNYEPRRRSPKNERRDYE